MLLPYSTDATLYHLPIATVSLIVVNTLIFFAYPLRTNDDLSIEQVIMLVNELHEDGAISDEEFDQFEKEAEQEEAEEFLDDEELGEEDTELEATEDVSLPAPDPLSLQYGRGLLPWQWITSNFLHADIFHLIGNMIWLWTFGLIVEGKIGWKHFLFVFFGIGISECFIEQTLMLFSYPTPWSCSLGASSIIFGLMAISMLWIPANDIQCLIIIWPWSFPAAGLGGFYLIYSVVLGLMFYGEGVLETPGTDLLHALGGVIGVGVGMAFLKYDLVDCDNWDIFSVWAGKHRMSREEAHEMTVNSEPFQAKQKVQIENGLNQIRELLQQGQAPQLAYRAHISMQQKYEGWHLPDAEFLLIIKQLSDQQMFDEAIQAINEYFRTPRAKQNQVRLKQAAILLNNMQSPAQALSALAKVNASELNDRERAFYRQLAKKAESMKDDDVLDLLGD